MGKKRKIINSTKYARKYSNHPLARARAEKPAVVEAVEVVVEAVQDVVETVVEAVAETVQSVVEDVSETVQSVAEDVSETVQSVAEVVSYEKPSNPVKTSKVRKAAPKRKPTKKNKKSEG